MPFIGANISSALKRMWFRRLYDGLATRFQNEKGWVFMNYGYAALGGPLFALSPAEAPSQHPLQLYRHVVRDVELANRDVLEIGSGRGGGAAHLARALRPKSMVGLDYSPPAVDFSNRVHAVPGLRFVTGDAERLPFASESFDIVLNVESSHCYGSVPRFLSEVRRVLRPGGRLCLADFRVPADLARLRAELADAHLAILTEELITPAVCLALERDGPAKLAALAQMKDLALRREFGEFCAAPGTSFYDAFASGALAYVRYDCTPTKPAGR